MLFSLDTEPRVLRSRMSGEWLRGLWVLEGSPSILFMVLGVGMELLRCVLKGGRALGSRSKLRQDLGLLAWQPWKNIGFKVVGCHWQSQSLS